ncbi:aspartate/glutamate racemase family protein [Acididesulfobacillus acetoxydans]|uniref:aspartate/glutamate racemase family protein n=1 Tax=Acididesulfobacillus acetoxydans TaxID=1561005 RepID=UPI001F1060C4|nr:amino acid racemase [Acididesulfobacillus acetoxydans]
MSRQAVPTARQRAAECINEEVKRRLGGLHSAKCILYSVDFLLILTNTMHKVATEVEARVRIPLLHIADITARRVLADGKKTVGLLGTKYTMEQDFYRARLEAQGLKVLVPEERDRGFVNTVIFQELCLGRIVDESRAKYRRIISDLIERGADSIVLGCTEIGLLVKREDSSVPIFDTTLLHAQGAVEFALSQQS